MQELKAWSKTAEFKMHNHSFDGRITPLIMEWNEVFETIGDKLTLLVSLKESPHYNAFSDSATSYETNITLLNNYLQKLSFVQRKWIYLEPIGTSGALPSGDNLFKRIDSVFRSVMSQINTNRKLYNLVDSEVCPHLQSNLINMEKDVEHCQRSLFNFLEERRMSSPRLYFLGNDTLLSIIGSQYSISIVQPYLKDLFQGIHIISVDNSNAHIISFGSNAGEEVKLKQVSLVSDGFSFTFERS